MTRVTAAPPASSLALAGPGLAANRELERLQVQVASLQTQIAELQRLGRRELKEVRRLNELLAEQNARLPQEPPGPADPGRVGRRPPSRKWPRARGAQRASAVGRAQRGLPLRPAADPSSRRRRPAARRCPAAPMPGGRPPAAGRAGGASPAPRELYSQAYADYARGNYDLAIQGFSEYISRYPEHRLHRQRAVLGRRVALRQEAVRRGDRSLEHAVPRLSLERQASRRAGQEGHGPRAARAAGARPSSSTDTSSTASRTPPRPASPASG